MKVRRHMQDRPLLLPEHLRPVPPSPPARGWLWQVPLGVLLTLGALYLAAGQVDHCAQQNAFCQSPAVIEDSAAVAQVAAPAPSFVAPERPVMTHALAPLPLSLGDGDATQNYVLPPGQTVTDAATQAAAITLNDMNLIAVVEANGIRHALVRLPGGRIVRLREGDRLDDGTVAAIGARTLYMLGPDNTPRALTLGG